ncbi:sensory box protein [Asticcacaulis biprosthecium C19]|uniref:histidine kinase n=1 Tax=Asticcacaulis biprosthecium C19 TaxID=715226 RepID=F4QJT0_9CAUL|nr:PAS domain S-box protein [Asticcacaulis biprosthecium]EGF93187.1 sensory box protein [Asticcacaulis biprosthecium C19]
MLRAEYNKDAAFLLKLNDALRTQPDADAVANRGIAMLAEALDLDCCYIALLDLTNDRADMPYQCRRNGFAALPLTVSLQDFPDTISHAAEGTTVLHNVSTDPRLSDRDKQSLMAIGLKSLVVAALRKGENNPVWALVGVTSQPRTWLPADVTLIEDVAERIWAAMERAHAEARLRESESRYRLLFESIDSGFCVVEVNLGDDGEQIDYRVLEANPAFYHQTGFPVDILGHWLRAAAPGLEEHWFETYGRIARTGEHERFEHGSALLGRRFDVYAFPAGGREGRRVAILFNDITARRKAETGLQESEARFRNMADHAPVMTWVTDASGYCTYLNRAWYEFTGQTKGEAEGFGWLTVTHPDDKARADEVFRQANEDQKPFRIEYRLRHADGSYRWAIDAAAPRFDQDGQFLGYIGSVIDISERKEAELALRELNDRLESRVAEALAERKVFSDVIEGATAGVTALDLGYTILAINKSSIDGFEAGFGKRPRVGDNFLELFAGMPGHLAQHREIWSRALTGEDFSVVQAFGEEHRARRYFDVRFSALRDPAGAVIGASSTSYDVTEKVQAERQLDMAQQQLRQSQKMEAMGQLTGGVAHDFNNLLGPIIGSLDMLQRRGVGGEREQRMIANALQSADRARVLVQRLLAFARRQPLQAEAVDVKGLIEGMADLVASTSGPTIRVELDLAPNLPSARADANQLEMALLNLAGNARDAMPDGGRLVIAAAQEVVEAGHHRANLAPATYIRLSVSDSGLGMDTSTLARAVEPFFSTKGVGKGTGLGLSMVHGLAGQLGGELAISSKPGLGTRVELWLPVSEDAAERSATAAVAATSHGSGTILVVDDEDLVRATTTDMLTELGYKVVEAASAEDALHVLRDRHDIDMLVTDHLMAGMNGTDLVRQMRAERPDLLTLVVSGYADIEGVTPDIARLVKPFRQTDLAAAIKQLLSS